MQGPMSSKMTGKKGLPRMASGGGTAKSMDFSWNPSQPSVRSRRRLGGSYYAVCKIIGIAKAALVSLQCRSHVALRQRVEPAFHNKRSMAIDASQK